MAEVWVWAPSRQWAALTGGLADYHGAQSPVCAGGPSMAHCHQSFTEGSRRLVIFYVITLTELDPPGFGNIKNVTYMFEISHLNWWLVKKLLSC